MIIFFTLLGFFLIQYSLDLSKIIANFSLPFQKSCENLSISMLNFQDIHQSLLCGSSLPPTQFTQNLREQALIHLFIVSGGHFIFLENLLIKIKIPKIFHAPALVFYNVFTGFQAPGTRSLTYLLLSRCIKDRFFNLRDDQVLLLCGLILIALIPRYISSSSFLLSWTAALSLNISSSLFFHLSGFKKIFYMQIAISLLLLPWLCSFGNGHPLGVLSNIIFGPFIIFILFPLSALVIIAPALTSLFEFFLRLLDWMMTHCSEVFQSTTPSGTSIIYFWTYLFTLHIGFHAYQVNYWRKSS